MQQADQEALYDDFAATLDQALDEVDDIEGGIARALEEPAARSAVQGLYVEVTAAELDGTVVRSSLPWESTRGFNASDGD
ncbi:MAG: hypothetical protein U5L98_04640 [Halomonas sp.]|uniref:hypothetical protein n=1 Tax=Halomonas sp. TaxID=1486246 RepID=UPI002ACDBD08|nr:hypothetical protein [Halomonas sp.]MDZ7851941.1 hypothetical protein [Halomonas sp.]